ncbi:c-type cytochrome [Pseudidiomarina sp. WS423]|uniref:c-type cytochrome n=1 Tax=Pseudidiomarina sp. WS423 TaxID=3425124 RepID=UPI003D6DF80E
MKIKVLFAAWVCAGLMQAPAYAKGDAANGQALATQGDGSGAPCAACHGANGEGMAAGTFPRIAGLDADYALRQMVAFQQGKRVNPAMTMNIDNFNQQQLADLAAYFATLPVAAPAAATASQAQLELGEKLALQGNWDNYLPPCASCHGPNNQGVDGNFPGIAGQHASYLKQQLQAWQQGQRQSDPVQLMEAIAKRLSPEQIDAVAAYLASQPAAPQQ